MNYSIMVFIFNALFAFFLFNTTAEAVTLYGFAGKSHIRMPTDCYGFSFTSTYDDLGFCIQDSSLNKEQQELMSESAQYPYHGSTPPPALKVEGYFAKGSLYVQKVTQLQCSGSCSTCDDLPYSFLYACVNKMDSPNTCKKTCIHHW